MKLRMKKIPRPEVFKMFSSLVGSGTSSGLNPEPWSCTLISKAFGSVSQLNFDDFRLIEFVSMNHRVRHRFPDCHVYSKGDVLRYPEAIQEFRNCRSGLVDSLNTAGEAEFSRL